MKAEKAAHKKEAAKHKADAKLAKAKAKAANKKASKVSAKRRSAHRKAMEDHLDRYLSKRRHAAKNRNEGRAVALLKHFKPRVVHVRPGPNPHFYPNGTRYYAPSAVDAKFVVPLCPKYRDWVDTRYYHKIKNNAIKARYSFARKNCMKKGLSMKQRYECFKLHWKQYKPGTKNTIHQVRDRVQRDCMKYKYNPKLRRMCFKAHVKHYKNSLLAENDEQVDAEQAEEMEAIDATMNDDLNSDEAELLLKVAEVAGGDSNLILVKNDSDSDSTEDSN